MFAPFEEKYSVVAQWPPELPFPKDAVNGARHLQMEHSPGPWCSLTKIQALAVAKTEEGVVIHGDRNLQGLREDGYNHSGTVSVGGKRFRAFTSQQTFRYEGRLYDFAILYVCGGEK